MLNRMRHYRCVGFKASITADEDDEDNHRSQRKYGRVEDCREDGAKYRDTQEAWHDKNRDWENSSKWMVESNTSFPNEFGSELVPIDNFPLFKASG